MTTKQRPSPSGAMINLGCGTRFHPAWLNLDFSPLARRVRWPRVMEVLGRFRIISPQAYRDFLCARGMIQYGNLRRLPLSLPGGCAKVVYHSNVLEHFPREHAKRLCEECFRLLEDGGILRVVVPDLERPIRAYLGSLEPVLLPEQHQQAIHDLFDQFVRSESGGKRSTAPLSLAARIKRWCGMAPTPESLGELHKWMYDEHSLKQLLKAVGFSTVRRVTYNVSAIPNFNDYQLDSIEDGKEYKRDMLYVETIK